MLSGSSSLLSFYQSHFSQTLQMPGTSDGDPISRCRYWVDQAVFIMGQTSRCCLVCLMPQSQVSISFEYPDFDMFTLDRPTCVDNRLSAFQVVRWFYAPAGRWSSAVMLKPDVHTRDYACLRPDWTVASKSGRDSSAYIAPTEPRTLSRQDSDLATLSRQPQCVFFRWYICTMVPSGV